ncbi:UNVERIFIED_CONTAM: hypothetical protein FKN15_002903 [Acipenser sinensis]
MEKRSSTGAVLRRRRKVVRDWAVLTSVGRSFHRCGASVEKERALEAGEHRGDYEVVAEECQHQVLVLILVKGEAAPAPLLVEVDPAGIDPLLVEVDPVGIDPLLVEVDPAGIHPLLVEVDPAGIHPLLVEEEAAPAALPLPVKVAEAAPAALLLPVKVGAACSLLATKVGAAGDWCGSPPIAGDWCGSPPIAGDWCGSPPIAGDWCGSPPIAGDWCDAPSIAEDWCGAPSSSEGKTSNGSSPGIGSSCSPRLGTGELA